MVLQLVLPEQDSHIPVHQETPILLPGEALVAVGTGVRLLSRVEQLVSDHVLRSGELLAADITGMFVVVLGAAITHSVSLRPRHRLTNLWVFMCWVSLLIFPNCFPHC